MEKLFKNVYHVVENPNEENAGIEIVTGEFKGLVYQYGRVEFEEGKPQLNFERTIRTLPEDGREVKELEKNEELNTLIGDIHVDLMQEQIHRDNKNE